MEQTHLSYAKHSKMLIYKKKTGWARQFVNRKDIDVVVVFYLVFFLLATEVREEKTLGIKKKQK